MSSRVQLALNVTEHDAGAARPGAAGLAGDGACCTSTATVAVP